MKKWCVLIGCVCLSSLSYGQQMNVKLWPGTVPEEKEAKHEPVEYTANTSGHNIHRITDITDPDMVIYKPGKNSNGAAVIICPGGGNKYLAINIEGEEIAAWLTAKGYTAIVLRYRVPLKSLGEFQDIQRAVRLVRYNAYKWKLKTDMIGVMGFSAGGNLSARAITGFKNRSYPIQDKADSISCKPDFAMLIYPGSLSTTADKNLIPELKVTEETPPVFVFVAADDPYNIPFQFGQALRDLKLPFEFHVVPKGGHGYGLRAGNAAAEAWPKLAEKWLNQTLATKF